MVSSADVDLSVLHGLRLRSFAGVEAIADRVGITPSEADGRLQEFAQKDWVRYREGVLTGWSLRPSGRDEALRLVSEQLEASGARETVESAYRDFLALNDSLLSVCTDWQLRPAGGDEPELNDHSDASYDAAVVDSLRAIDDAVQPVCAQLGAALDRFGGYGRRLRTALEKIEAGEGDWFTKPTIDSYHGVWFELHEDLLVTLGLERGNETTTQDPSAT